MNKRDKRGVGGDKAESEERCGGAIANKFQLLRCHKISGKDKAMTFNLSCLEDDIFWSLYQSLR